MADANEAHRARRLTWWSDAQLLHLRGALPTEAGAQLTGVLTALAEGAPRDPETDTYEPFEARAADALVELAATRAGESRGPRPSLRRRPHRPSRPLWLRRGRGRARRGGPDRRGDRPASRL